MSKQRQTVNTPAQFMVANLYTISEDDLRVYGQMVADHLIRRISEAVADKDIAQRVGEEAKKELGL